MAKRMQLVLNENIYKLGKVGSIVEVAPGYARNYLLPRGLAQPATPGALKQVARLQEQERQRFAELKLVAVQQKATLETIGTFSIAMPAGEKDALFGSVTHQDVADAIKAIAQETVDKREITMPDIRKLGSHTAEIKLHPEVTATITVLVVPE
ncbi:50S ribosomal protein L9 [Synechococcus sp. PCC 6312]|uniref:50S ribosomal protein L9 n=1 Tax=Synechococcus sp. (strain ATCC 27167 / PCC 6312) TaxID=195253 RepID=UPI00029F2B7E|nr:50S ribosomal protein L9 [Synechococcus sp. PCC 6312]AFY61707.1 LSU ribosomal protein L9P [Synechococcus sp. PCC 6312]